MSISTVLNRLFAFDERKTNPRTEIFAGITTFAAMAYIIFVQPGILSGQTLNTSTGMEFGALVTTTCLASAFGCILMGLLANFPVGLAPGMGENFYFVLTVLPACALALNMKAGAPEVWQLGLGIVFVSGILFAVISFLNIRKFIMDAISPSMKYSIAAGIGLFITLIGFRNGGIIVTENGLYGLTTSLKSPNVIIFCIGLITISVLHIRKVRGAILIGIVVAAIAALLFGQIKFDHGILGLPASPMPVMGKLDITGVFKAFGQLFPLIIIFTFIDVFDTLGCVVGIASCAGLMKNNELPNSARIFASDATATVAGSVMGHTTVTTYIESAAGVEAGGKTGLTAVVIGICFLLALFFTPFICAVAGCMPVTAPALVVVGTMMMQNVSKIKWEDFSEAIPSFLIISGIPFCYSIADGMGLGFISYPIIKILSGKGKEIGWLNYVLAAILIAFVIFLKS